MSYHCSYLAPRSPNWFELLVFKDHKSTAPEQKIGFMTKVQNFFSRNVKTATVQCGETNSQSQNDVMHVSEIPAVSSPDPAAPELQQDLLLPLVSLQKASGCWELDAALATVFGKTKDELTNQKPAEVDGSVWATLLALIWLYGWRKEQQVEWQFVARKAAAWIASQKVGDLSQCVCVGNVLLGCEVTKDTMGI